MRDIDLFQVALGLVPPWMVADAKFDAEKKRLDIEIGQNNIVVGLGATVAFVVMRPHAQ